MNRFSLLLAAALALGPQGAATAHASAPVLTVQVLAERPHDPAAFTQGLALAGGLLYESTGLYGRSCLRAVDPTTGRVLRNLRLNRNLFGEGLAVWKEKLFQLTWKENLVLVHDRATLRPLGVITRQGEAWGLTADNTRLILSNGSATLRFLSPGTMAETGSVTVTDAARPVTQLNELEWVDGLIYANIWRQDRIAIINPDSGRVLAFLDISGLRTRLGHKQTAEAANGLAYDPERRRLLVTGKFWDTLFELALPALPPAAP